MWHEAWRIALLTLAGYLGLATLAIIALSLYLRDDDMMPLVYAGVHHDWEDRSGLTIRLSGSLSDDMKRLGMNLAALVFVEPELGVVGVRFVEGADEEMIASRLNLRLK